MKFCLVSLLLFQSALAQDLYSDRPSILDVPAVGISNIQITRMGSDRFEWGRIKESLFHFVAFLEATKPNAVLYFLARDAEFMYDIASLMHRGSSRMDQIKLINVSRDLSESPMLKDYLEANGIDSSRKSNELVFVDTGFAGTIPDEINNLMERNWSGVLLRSDNYKYPQSEFAQKIASTTTVETIEHLPHWSSTAHKFVRRNGVVEAYSDARDGTARSQAMALMQDIRNTYDNPESVRRFNLLVKHIKSLYLYSNKKIKSGKEVSSARSYLKRNIPISAYESLLSDLEQPAFSCKSALK